MRALEGGQDVIIAEGNSKRRAETPTFFITIEFVICAEIIPYHAPPPSNESEVET